MALDEAAFRAHLNMTEDEAAGIDAASLSRVLDAASKHTERQLGYQLDDVIEFPDGTPADLEQAVLLLAAHWFSEREAATAGVTVAAIPFGYDDIIRSHRRWTFG